MKYGFIIDNRKCIGCHACTTACKSEHQVPVGVNRTWVKQVEKGTFPNSRRLFSVMRCNHCTDAPCVEICPTEALNIRTDGIVDFDKERCIGCKSCMQACPYDALYIDPDTHTAAKCNYCAHRIDLGLEPACVNVCPEHAIISGDMDDPESEIAQLLMRQQVKVRKPEKATIPNLFYIDADDSSLIPSHTEKKNISLWGSQGYGVGHYAKEAEKMAFSNIDVVEKLIEVNGGYQENGQKVTPPKSVELVMDSTKRVYDSPDKGILWGWEVSAYVWTKAISAGAFLALFIGWLTGTISVDHSLFWVGIVTGIVFLGLTGLLLIKDLDRPDRFLYVLLRPHWTSWLVRGGYAISVYGGLLTLLGLSKWLGWEGIYSPLMWLTGISGIAVAIYTAFLFAQAKGRDFWQSPTLAAHMLVHSIMAGAAFYLVISAFLETPPGWVGLMSNVLMISLIANLFILASELVTNHPTKDAGNTVKMILKGRYKTMFWIGTLIIGNIIPIVALAMAGNTTLAIGAGVLTLIGIYITEHIWVEAPQRIPLS